MGEQDLFQREAALRHVGQQALGLAAGIDQRSTALRIPHQRAVLLIRVTGRMVNSMHAIIPSNSMPAPDALLLISTHCPHCPTMLAALADLVKQGAIGRLEAVNLEQHPEIGQSLACARCRGCASDASNSPACTARPNSPRGRPRPVATRLADWFHLLLKEGQLPRAQAAIEADPALLAACCPSSQRRGQPQRAAGRRRASGALCR